MYNLIIHKLSLLCKIPVVIYKKGKLVRPHKKLYTVIVSTLYSFFTGLAVVIFLGVVIFFVGYPLYPEFKKSCVSLKQFSPYNIGYLSAIQILVKLSPPVYEFDADSRQEDQISNPDLNSAMEYIEDDKSISISHLEEKGTILQIDSASVSGKVVDGLSQDSMLRGFWHYPVSSAPGKKGNTVIFGHRFDRLPPSTDTFFYLDQIVVGDKVKIIQTDRDFTYTVVKTTVVDKTDDRLLEDTGGYQLTLITCTPLWTSDQRLVIIALQDRVATVI